MIIKDSWLSRGKDAGKTWTRAHNTPRICLFTPMRVGRGPAHGDEVGNIRVTCGMFDNGERFYLEDDWKTSVEPHAKQARHWTGVTTFRR